MALGNDLFRNLTRSGRSRLVLVQPWGSIEGGMLGADLTFRLPYAIDVDAALPVADIPPDAPTRGRCERPYRQTWLHEESQNVTELSVLVDLQRGTVAEITTNASRGRHSWIEGQPHPSCVAIPAG